MTEKDWERVGLPPLRMTLPQLEELVTAAGPGAEITRSGEDSVPLDELVPEGSSLTRNVIIRAPEFKLELAAEHAALSFDDHCAQKAEKLVHRIAKTSGALAMLIPLIFGVAIFVPMTLLGYRLDIASLATMAGMLLGLIAVMLRARSYRIISEPVEGEKHRWHSTFPWSRLSFESLGELVAEMGDEAQLEFANTSDGPGIVIRAPGIELILKNGTGEVVYDDAASRIEDFYDRVHEHKRPLRMFTHDDLAIFAGMLLPMGALFLAPHDARKTAVLITVVPWLLYLQWVLGNQQKRWCTIVKSSADSLRLPKQP